MVKLPAEFVATKYPGYFWNLADKKLYSCKVTGELKPMAFKAACRWNHGMAGYQVSVRGEKRHLYLVDLLKLKSVAQIFPVAQIT